MSAAAQATEVVAKREVVKRETLLEGVIVTVGRLPKWWNDVTLPDGQTCSIGGVAVEKEGGKDGFVNVNRFGELAPQYKADVVLKTMDDGTEFLYVDLHPTDEIPTHKLEIIRNKKRIPAEFRDAKPQQFNCTGNLHGCILVIKA